jgi:hypothetical protein
MPSNTHPVFIAHQPLAPYSNQPHRQIISQIDYECEVCKAKHFLEEQLMQCNHDQPSSFSTCCHQGKVIITPPGAPPEPLLSLLTGHDDHCMSQSFHAKLLNSQPFLENIRSYNNTFSFTSLGVQLDRSVMGPMSVYTFQIHGELFHLMGSLLPELH